MKNLTLIIPAKNKEDSLPQVLAEIKNYECNKIVILEETDFKTINAIKNFDCKLVYQTGRGYGNALIEGMKNVKTEYTCIFNADGSFNPKYLEEMLGLCKSDRDFVFASRYLKGAGSDDDNLITSIGNFVFSLMGRIMLNVKLSDILYTYVICNTKKFKMLKIVSQDFRFCIELPYNVANNKFNYTEIKSKEFKRKFGKKNVNELKDGFLILMEIIKCFLKRIMKI